MNKPTYSRWFTRWIGSFSLGVLIVNGWPFIPSDIQFLIAVALLIGMWWLVVWDNGNEDHSHLVAGVILLFITGVLAAWVMSV